MLLGRDGASDGELSLTGLSIDWPGKPRPDDGDSLFSLSSFSLVPT